MNIHLVTVVGSHIDLLHHMLQHYRQIGVDSLTINIHLETYADPLYGQILDIAKQYDGEIGAVYAGKWLQSVNPFLYGQAREKRPKDWFVVADVDEFQIYPRDLRDFLTEMEECGYDHVEGCFVDRIGKEGSFPEVSQAPLWGQFPLAGMITYPLLGGNIQKIVAAKGTVKLGPGQHFARNGAGCPRQQEYIPVHHFKWSKGLIERLRKRAGLYKAFDDPIWVESQRFIDYYDAHGGCFDISDPRLLLAECGKEYPLWKYVKELVLLNTPRDQQERRNIGRESVKDRACRSSITADV
jgi:hypothetical protein